jgi:hypothetical protein
MLEDKTTGKYNQDEVCVSGPMLKRKPGHNGYRQVIGFLDGNACFG